MLIAWVEEQTAVEPRMRDGLEIEIAGRRVEVSVDAEFRRGRGARSNVAGRFEAERREGFDDGWERADDLQTFATQVRQETARSIIAKNDSPDIRVDQ